MSDTTTLVADTASTLSFPPNGPLTVITFGTTGAGKSSVINLLPDDPAHPAQKAVAGSSLVGVTAEVKPFHKMVDGRPFTVLDTMGTGETDRGTVPTHLAIEGLYDHLVTSSTPGVHLVLIVMKAGRMTCLDECNYLLARYLFGDEVPITLILTHMESMENRDTWWDEQSDRGRLGLLSTLGVVSFVGPRNLFQTFYNESKEDLSRFVSEHLRSGPGFKLQPKPRVSRLTAALASLLRKHKEAARFHAAMLNLLQSYNIADSHAKPLASKIQVTAPLPVVIFVGAQGSGKTTIINMLPTDQDAATNPPASPPTPGDVQEYIKVVQGQHICVLETPGIPLLTPSESNSATANRPVRALYDSFMARPLGIRLVVLVARVEGEDLAPVDVAHYRLIRRLCGDHLVVCLVTNGSRSSLTIRNRELAFQKHVPLPILSPSSARHQLDESRVAVENAVADLVKSGVDAPVQQGLDIGCLFKLPVVDHAVAGPVNAGMDLPVQQAKVSDTVTLVPHTASPPLSPNNATPTVIAFGTTGAGRSAVINMLADDPAYIAEKAVSKPSVTGVTAEIKSFHKMVDGRPFTILDTPGTGDHETGTTPTHLAIERLYDHLVASSTPGIHLVLIVMKAGRMSLLDECNYLLARYLFGDEVPIALVLTHMDNMDDKDTWWDEQENRWRLGLLKTVGVVSFVGTRNSMELAYNKSKEDLSRFMATQLPSGRGFKLQGKPRFSRLTAALASLKDRRSEATRFRAAMLQLLKDYEIADHHANRLASKMQVTAPLPVVVFVGAQGSGKTTTIDMLPTDTNNAAEPPTSPSTPGNVQESIKVVKGQRIRVLETLGIPLPASSDSTSVARAVRALYDAFVAHPLGVRLVVLVAKVEGQDLAPVDITHYRLVKQLCGDRSPICLITVQANNSASSSNLTIRDNELVFQKHVPLSTTLPRPAQGQLDTFANAIANLVKSNMDLPIQPTSLPGPLESLPGYGGLKPSTDSGD